MSAPCLSVYGVYGGVYGVYGRVYGVGTAGWARRSRVLQDSAPSEAVAEGLFAGTGGGDTLAQGARVSRLTPANTNRRPADVHNKS